MNTPNPVLMYYYGNEEVYKQKLAREQLQVPEDMVRLASIAAQAGADLAKSAGIVGSLAGGLVKSPLARKVVGGAALVGGGILAAKAIKKVPEVMGRESGAQTFGPGRFGFTPAGAVNDYGVAAPGSPVA